MHIDVNNNILEFIWELLINNIIIKYTFLIHNYS